MAWEKRGHKHRYFYRSVRRGGRVRKKYFGKGLPAQLVEVSMAIDREYLQQQREQERRQRHEYDEVAASLNQFWAESETLVAAGLVVAGYYRHDRGEWRRRYGRRETT